MINQNRDGNMPCFKIDEFYHSCHRYEQVSLRLFLHRLFPDSFGEYDTIISVGCKC